MRNERAEILRFGVFEVDARSGELRRQGARIRLQEQPFHVLTVLLQRPGEVVTREELRNQNWPADTFVDFDNSLNTAINKLREALGDSADSPRFIETLPRRGYRFIAPVTTGDGTTRRTAAGASAAVLPRSRKILVTIAVVVLAAGIAEGLLWRSRQARRLTKKDTIVLADFKNTTGDPVFDDTLKQGLRVQLEQSPFLNILSDQRVDEELPLMGHQKSERLTQDLARDLCQRLGNKAVLTGSISSLGTHYAVGLNAFNCFTGDELASEQVEADNREHVLKALGESATQMRKKLGESLNSIQRFDAPIEQVTTPSLQALQAYSLGMKNKNANSDAGSIPFFKRAIELDPNFASAYARLGASYSNLWQVTLANENFKKAFELREQVSDRERFFFSFGYEASVIGDYEKAAQTLELWTQSFPRDSQPWTSLANIYMKTGRWEKAERYAQEALALDPQYGANYFNLATIYLALGRLDAASDIGRQAMTKLDDSARLIPYWIAFLRQDARGMEEQINKNAGGPGEEDDLLLFVQSDTEAYRGRLANARNLSLRAVEVARTVGKESAAAWQVFAALRESEFGNQKQAHASTEAAMKLAANWRIEAAAALGLARAGDNVGAERLAVKLDNSFPISTALQGYWLPTIRSAIALNRGNATKAIELLQNTAPYELGVSSPTELGMMYPVYVRGQAYLMERQGKEAVAEFQKFLDHPGIVLNFPLGALAHLGLARAHAMQGDTAKSRAAYQDFLTLWKDADPDIPIFKEAKAEYAKLQ
jgi:DNA-binding winged helix-turn-helix (wHTH) protein/tetratricopeptide (TPR) repeat protein